MPDELLQHIRKRRSIRRFTTDSVPVDVTDKLIEAARWAPSAGNLQPWYFYVVHDPAVRRCLADAAFGQHFAAEAPVCIVVCAEPRRSARIYGRRGEDLYCIQDTAAAAQNILLAAADYGLGSCWVGAFNEDRVRACLGIPDSLRPLAIIAVGYPADGDHPIPARRELESIRKYV